VAGGPHLDFEMWETMNFMARKRRLLHRRWLCQGTTLVVPKAIEKDDGLLVFRGGSRSLQAPESWLIGSKRPSGPGLVAGGISAAKAADPEILYSEA